MPGIQAPLGQLEAIMVAKESTYGQFSSTNPLYHAFATHAPKITTAPIDRMPRTDLAKPYPGTGGRSVASSLDVETTEDTFPQWLAYAMGAQTNPSATLFTSTLNGAVVTGATTCTLASTNFLCDGQQLTIDVGGANPEIVTITGISGLNQVTFTPALGHNHTNGVTCSVVAGSGARASVLTLGSPLPSFTMQVFRPGGTSTDYLGACVDQLTLSASEGQAVKAKLSLKAQQAVKDASPLTPTMSVLNPFIVPQQNTYAQIGGEVASLLSAATLKSWQITINNNLKENWAIGGGNTVRNFLEGVRSYSGTFTYMFDSDAMRANFDAALSGGNLPPITALIPIVGTDSAGTASPYALGLWMPAVFLSTFSLADDTSKPCEQTIAFQCGPTGPGTNDHLSITTVSRATAKY